ncbi:MAG: sodium ion-translocating decarboxylase beta subunit, partial [Arenicella sp.]
MENLNSLWLSSGLAQLQAGQAFMLLIGLGLLFLAIKKGFEPLLLVPIGFGTLLANIPGAGFDAAPIYDALGHMESPGGLLYYIYSAGIETGLFPLIIFMGVGAMTDFGPLLANPKTLLLGAAAQVGIFSTVLGAVALSHFGILDFSIRDAASIGIIGGADGPTAIFVTSKLSPDLLGAVAVAAYSYMALVPIIQPPIMRAMTTQAEREIKMHQLRDVSIAEKIVFPLTLLILVALLLPDAAPLLGMFCFGNLMRECGVVNRLSE